MKLNLGIEKLGYPWDITINFDEFSYLWRLIHYDRFLWPTAVQYSLNGTEIVKQIIKKQTQPKMSILLQQKIRNLKKIFCLVLIVSLLRMGYLYIQEKDFRITDLQNELRFEVKKHCFQNIFYNFFFGFGKFY